MKKMFFDSVLRSCKTDLVEINFNSIWQLTTKY